MKVRCGSCERLELVNDALRDRCGSLELINEGLNERAVAQLNVDPNTDLNGRVAVLQLDRAMRRIRELEAELAAERESWTDENDCQWLRPTAWAYAQACRKLHELEAQVIDLEARLNPPAGCPDCGSSEITGDVQCSGNEERDVYRCGGCGSVGPAEEVKNAA